MEITLILKEADQIQEDRCPVIVGERYDLAETEALLGDWEYCKVLPGQTDNQAALPSMSDYRKFPGHSVGGK